ncbi:glycosyltransferase family 2 protein [Pimelobacter simplex]|uniref:glycosyltransferase family 2 protein n=1 Tax=Nocardioides simplex TaxID=2045 RepID=UPI003AAA45E0
MSPSITVIVPTRHRPDYLDVTVRSILTAAAELQVAHGVGTRVLVVDDAPDNDDALEVTRRLGADYVRVEEHDGRKDPGAAIVLGVQNVTSTYQTIFGDDDIMLPRHLTAAWELLQDGYDVVSSSFTVVDARLAPLQTRLLEPAHIGDLVAGHTWMNDGSFVAHELVRDLDWDVALEAHMLVPIWGRLLLDGRRFGQVREATWLYRRHDANISQTAHSPHDRALREKVLGRLAEDTRAVLGEVPASPYAERLAAEAEERRLVKERKAARKAERRQAEEAARAASPITRARRRLARSIAP